MSFIYHTIHPYIVFNYSFIFKVDFIGLGGL